MLGIQPRASCIQDEHSTPELHFQPCYAVSFRDVEEYASEGPQQCLSTIMCRCSESDRCAGWVVAWCSSWRGAATSSLGLFPKRGEESHTNIPIFKLREWGAEKFQEGRQVTELPRDSNLGAQQPGKAATKLLGFNIKKKLLTVIQRSLRIMRFCDTS